MSFDYRCTYPFPSRRPEGDKTPGARSAAFYFGIPSAKPRMNRNATPAKLFYEATATNAIPLFFNYSPMVQWFGFYRRRTIHFRENLIMTCFQAVSLALVMLSYLNMTWRRKCAQFYQRDWIITFWYKKKRSLPRLSQ